MTVLLKQPSHEEIRDRSLHQKEQQRHSAVREETAVRKPPLPSLDALVRDRFSAAETRSPEREHVTVRGVEFESKNGTIKITVESGSNDSLDQKTYTMETGDFIRILNASHTSPEGFIASFVTHNHCSKEEAFNVWHALEQWISEGENRYALLTLLHTIAKEQTHYLERERRMSHQHDSGELQHQHIITTIEEYVRKNERDKDHSIVSS